MVFWRDRFPRDFSFKRWGAGLAFFIILLGVPTAPAAADSPVRLKRSESFLGIHFDFHAGKEDREIGARTTREMIESVIDQVQPDYIQIDSKGHPGISSYPTKVGSPAPGIVKDQLALWRQVTAERGVALYLHHSGVWDEEAVRQHPEWARINERGKRDARITSVFGPYVDHLLIPQLKELSGVYGVDGVWVDGECWATLPDYGKEVLRKFRQETGLKTVPRQFSDPNYFEFMQFCREGFRRYLRHYVDELHRSHPGFQITSNWSYSNMMPEAVAIDLDYLSGDYDMQNSLNSARLAGRCLRHQGKPWDLMAWSFASTDLSQDPHFSTKTVPQLQQEAAAVLALGGGFQAYFQQKRDGSISPWQMRLMREAARFCRDRQSYCHRAEPVPQIALLYPTESAYRKFRRPFSPWAGELDALKGILQMLLDRQFPADLQMDHQIRGRMQQYPLIVVPEWEFLQETLRQELLAYVREGGNLLLAGPRTAALWTNELGVEFTGARDDRKYQFLSYRDWMAPVPTQGILPNLAGEARTFGRLFEGNDLVGSSSPAASILPIGKGKLGALYFSLGERYLTARNSLPVDLMCDMVRELFPSPLVEVKGGLAEVVINRVGGKLAINLINLSGPHEDRQALVFDEIPPVGPLEIRIRQAVRPSKILLEPEHQALEFQYGDGMISLILPQLKIHSILMVE